jgi:hypothetical protein
VTKFGPGVLTIGEVAAAVDVSCLINGAKIAATVDAAEATTKLCGTVAAGNRTYEWEFTGNMDIDPADPAGIFILSQTEYGSEQPFVFTPNDTAAELTATGVLIIDPLDFGGDTGTYGETMTSDFTWAVVGVPVFTPVAAADALADDDAPPARSRKSAKSDAAA